jgi:hypothetical protein
MTSVARNMIRGCGRNSLNQVPGMFWHPAHRDVQGGKFVLGKFLQWYRSYFCIKLLLVSLWPSKFPVKF